MSAQHTEGPWLVSPGNETEVFSYGSRVKNVARAHCGGMSGIRVDEAEANARLIAAAPELLEALELVADTYGFDSSTDSSIWQTVFAAIAAAKGAA